jgi:hypothetical protein
MLAINTDCSSPITSFLVLPAKTTSKVMRLATGLITQIPGPESTRQTLVETTDQSNFLNRFINLPSEFWIFAAHNPNYLGHLNDDSP